MTLTYGSITRPCFRDIAEVLARRLPSARLQPIGGAGHVPQIAGYNRLRMPPRFAGIQAWSWELLAADVCLAVGDEPCECLVQGVE